jgi:flagellin-specific chaperone FliS
MTEHNAVGFKVEFKFNGSLPNLFQGFTIDQWFTHHPPRTEARKLEHGKVDKAIRTLAEELLLHANDVVKESASEECTATIRTIQALPITIEWAAECIDAAREAMYIGDDKERAAETIYQLSQARQTLHQGIALLELQQLGEANPEEVKLREEIKGRGKEELMRSTKADLQKQRDEVITDRFNLVTDLQSQIDTAQAKIANQETYIAELEERLEGSYAEGKAPMPDAVRLELERARDEVREASAAVKTANQQSYIAALERDTALARIAELEERLKEPGAEAYTKELEDRLERLGEHCVEDIANLQKQIGFLSRALATTKHTPTAWRQIAAKVVEMTQEAE